MQIVKEIVEQQLGRKLIINNAPQVKFLQLMTPEVQADIQIQWTMKDDTVAVNTLFKSEKDLFKMTATFS